MGTDPRNGASERNWRLQAELQTPSAPEHLVASLRDPAIMGEAEASALHDVVITHDGELLFAYAADQPTIQETRDAIVRVMARDGVAAPSIRLSHWDTVLDDWRQFDPPPSTPQEKQADEAAELQATAMETRTLVARVGRLIRAEFERSLNEWASELGVQCTVIEHPHLLTSQVGFTITGPKRKLDEFDEGLKAEEWVTIRLETQVMLGPL